MQNIRTTQRAPKACQSCANRRVKCDKKIPCGTCLARGLEASCAREEVRVRGKLVVNDAENVLSYAELQQENARLRAQLTSNSLLSTQPSYIQTRSRWPIVRPDTQIDFPRNQHTYLRNVWKHVDIQMPSQSCSNALLEHGFIWTSWIHFAVHIPTFRREHDSAWATSSFLDNDKLWLAIYFGFIAHSLMFMDENEARKAGIPSENASEQVRNWYDAALYFLDEADFLRNHRLRTVQAIAILLSLSKNVGDFDIESLLLSTGIRIGQIIGMNQEPPDVSDDPVVQEISRRTWWTLIICEWLSIPHHTPCIRETDFNVNVPLNLLDGELCSKTFPMDGVPSAPFNAKPIAYHNAMVSLAICSYRFYSQMSHIDEFDAKSLEKLVLEADEALANTITNLPPHLLDSHYAEHQNDGSHSSSWVLWQQTNLSLSFLFYRMVINRSIQHPWAVSSETSHIRSRKICIDSALAMTELVNQHRIVLARLRPWATTNALFTAAMTLAIETKYNDGPEVPEYAEGSRICMQFLEGIQDHNVLAARAIQQLRSFYSQPG